MSRISGWIVTLLIAALAGTSLGQPGGPPKAEKLRVGTFDARAVSIAYYRSKLHDQWLKDGTAEYRKAKDEGKTDLAERIRKRFDADQELAHRQTFGVGPYDSLAEQLKGVWPEVAKASKVDAIVPAVAYATDRAETVDVTETVLLQLGADEKTRKVIAEMREKIRAGQYDPTTYKGGH